MMLLRELRLTFILSIAFFISQNIKAQGYFPPVVNYTTKDYGKDQTPENYGIIQDDRGVIYVGNSGNVLEFDGINWRKIPVVQSRYVWSLGKDSTGNIYVGTTGDFGVLKPNKQGELVYESLLKLIDEEDRFFSNIWKIDSDGKKVYFQSEEYLFIYDGTSIEAIQAETSFHTAFFSRGKYFVRVREKGLCELKKGQLQLIPGGENFADYAVFGILPRADKSNSSMIVTYEKGLWMYDGSKVFKHPFADHEELNRLGIFGGKRLSRGFYALYSRTTGLTIIDKDGRVEHRITKRNGLRVNEINNIFEDQNQNLWITMNNGIAKINYTSPLSYFNEKTGLLGNVQTIQRYQEDIFVGTSYGLYKHNPNPSDDQEFIPVKDIKNSIWDLSVIGDQLMVASDEGFFLVKDNEVLQVSSLVTNALHYDSLENIVITAGPSGIQVFNSNNWQPVFQQPAGLKTVFGIEKSERLTDGNVHTYWLGTGGTGAFRLIKWADDFFIDQFDEMDGLPDDKIVMPFKYDKQVLFGSTQTLLRFVDIEEMKESFEEGEEYDEDLLRGYFDAFIVNDTLSFDAPIFAMANSENRLWLCKEDKISYFDKSSGFKELKRPFWGIDFGRINNFYLEPDGTLWVGAAEGLIRYRENNIKDYNAEFNTLVRSVVVGQDSVMFNGSFYNEKGWVQFQQPESMIHSLPYKNNAIKISFSATHFEDEHVPEFSFYLDGYDTTWNAYTTQTDVNYTNLHEGTYTFKVKAKNIYNNESEVASYTFTILPPWYRTFWAYIMYVLAFILFVFLAIKIASKRLKQQNIRLEEMVQERTLEISNKNVELEKQKDEILHQKTEIEDSINYAQRIQNAILPLREEMQGNLQDVFVIFMPKDIVSGDFYWYAKIGDEQVIVCADCTGHGVPGAFMSMIGSDKLNQTVREDKITDPSIILAEVNRGIKNALKQTTGDKESTRDGMDVSIITINTKTGKLRYSAANRPLWLLKDGEIHETKATKVALGGLTPPDQEFELHEFQTQPGEQYYMSSDGYADQFGGPEVEMGGKKLKVKNFKKLVIENSHLPMEEQKKNLEKAFFDWMGELEQVDDVCVIGVRL